MCPRLSQLVEICGHLNSYEETLSIHHTATTTISGDLHSNDVEELAKHLTRWSGWRQEKLRWIHFNSWNCWGCTKVQHHIRQANRHWWGPRSKIFVVHKSASFGILFSKQMLHQNLKVRSIRLSWCIGFFYMKLTGKISGSTSHEAKGHQNQFTICVACIFSNQTEENSRTQHTEWWWEVLQKCSYITKGV